jgi:hypothetical protein
MANSKDQLVTDVSFIFEECARLNQMVQDGKFRDIPREDAFCDLPHPTHNWPKGKMLCSRAGFNRLEALVRIALQRARLENRISLEPARSILGEILVRKFVREQRPIEIKHVDRALSEMAKRCGKTCDNLTHYIPCHLMSPQSPASFQIGPVRFLNQATFRSKLASHIWSNRSRDRALGARTISDAIRYFKTFGWIAELTVIGCDKKVSETTATRAVFAALNCLHVLIGPGHSTRMTVGGPGIKYDRRGGFTVTSDGELSYMASYGGPGEGGFEDNWIDLFSGEDAQQILANLGIALEHVVDPSLRRPLSERLLDAAQWYGEAVRETSPGAKAIKYVTALERMVMTDEKDDIAGLVSSRVAALCLDEPTSARRDRWRTEVKRAYDIRSKLVHGALSPSSDIVYEGVRLGAKLARDALLSATTLLGDAGFRDDQASNRQLGRWYDRLVAHADKVIEIESTRQTPNPYSSTET